MAILVAMEVGPVDAGKFRAAVQWMESKPEAGLRSSKVYAGEHDPKRVLVLQEWDSHEAFHTASDEHGDEFNERAGTVGLDWITSTWTTL